MPNEMTAAEATEIIERGDCGKCRYDAEDTAVRILRAIAAGEYKRVVHAHYGPENRCSVCGAPCKTFEHCANKPSEPVCWNCGALMDDSEEQKK